MSSTLSLKSPTTPVVDFHGHKKPLADTRDLVIHLLYHELVRAELILHLSGVGSNNPTSMLFIRSAISSTEKYLTK